MPQPNQGPVRHSIKASIDPIEQIRITVLEEPAHGIRAQVCDLHHARQSAFDEEWCLNEPWYLRKERSLCVETPHQVGQVLRGSSVFVLHQDRNGNVTTDQKVVQSANDLLESEVENCV
ncbi:MAG: hypothetical protein PHU25_21130 [Deltaproteobacteria bacterium]|nr:hypothetical protein [Deltaproteobacteria bacterium]